MAATLSTLEAAMAEATASRAPKVQPQRLTYAEARADLEARARAGQTVQGRDNRGCFTGGVKVFTAGVAPVAQAPAKVETVATVAKVVGRIDRERSAPAQVVAVSAGA